ncbi:MAG: TauD/TfdA family dioxygenase [Alphaproteobacteria bacterium]|jgi:alpha-ketoglutarate-dependent 2,4-dichlorophenoxyacetate dioxygenase|nr:TauD/TfdA family dioxygenase [Alphaproteobacteria bacterium]
MTVTHQKLSKRFAAEVRGIDIAAGVSAEDFAEVERLFNQHSVLVFRDQDIDDDQQADFSRRFGALEKTVIINEGGGTEIAIIANVHPETDEIIPPDDHRMVFNSGNEMWHSDSSFKAVPATASLLSGREVPPTGADTEFASMRAAYADLPAETKQRIEGLVAEHSILYSRSLIAPDLFNEEEADEVPPVRQAVVRENPVNGRKNFYVGSHASHIEGMDIEEGRALIGELVEFATRPEYVFAHKWRPMDLVMWDNRCCMHRGRSWEKARYRRVMHRTTVAGIGPT